MKAITHLAVNGPGNQHLASSPVSHLAGDEVQVWVASLEKPPEVVAGFSLLLSPDEKDRAGRFYFERDRRRYTVGRGLLRMFLGAFLAMKPDQIAFRYGAYGKPALDRVVHGRTLQFNLAHSNDLAVFIFCWDRPVGIDVEHVRPMTDEADFAERFFSPAESALIGSLSGEQKRNTFFKLWTCKEAFLKASGAGLTDPLNEVEFSFGDADSARIVSIHGDKKRAALWRMEMFKPAKGYQAACAVEGDAEQLVFRQADDYIPDRTDFG
jgi:4'-phosphopantetheinyl transferase